MLKPTNFPYNTLIPPVKKLDSSYRLVQDLRIIEAVIPIHSIVPNPYTLHSTIPPSTMDFIVLDLKDQFLTIPCPQDLLTFTWTDRDTRHSQQLIWTVLP